MSAQAVSIGSEETAGDMSADVLWGRLRSMMRERFGETAFRRWLEPVTADVAAAASGAQAVTLTLPTRFMRDWVEAHYGDAIATMWRQLTGASDVSYAVLSPLAKAAAAKDAIDHAAAAPIAPLGGAVPPIVASGSPLFADENCADLDPRFTFDNFVVGKPNELAYAAARRVADTENPAFNPLFLYGGVGLGKTHLMHAIAWHIRTNYPHRRVIYMSAEKFMYQFVRALRFKDTVAFKEQFRSVDVRSEERRVGKECRRLCRSRWSPYH
jgi:chromosomal replication initiator protein